MNHNEVRWVPTAGWEGRRWELQRGQYGYVVGRIVKGPIPYWRWYICEGGYGGYWRERLCSCSKDAADALLAWYKGSIR